MLQQLRRFFFGESAEERWLRLQVERLNWVFANVLHPEGRPLSEEEVATFLRHQRREAITAEIVRAWCEGTQAYSWDDVWTLTPLFGVDGISFFVRDLSQEELEAQRIEANQPWNQSYRLALLAAATAERSAAPSPVDDMEQMSEEQKARFVESLVEVALLGPIRQGVCPVCHEPFERKVQRGRSVYAEPCNHRLYQGFLPPEEQGDGQANSPLKGVEEPATR